LKVNIFLIIIKVEKVEFESVKKYDDSILKIATGIAGDETGKIAFRVVGGKN
jgi:hypothetical protein